MQIIVLKHGSIIQQATAQEVPEQVILVSHFGCIKHVRRMQVMHVLKLALPAKPLVVVEHYSGMLIEIPRMNKGAANLTLLGIGVEALTGRGRDISMLHRVHRRRRQTDGPIGEELLTSSILYIDIPRHSLDVGELVRLAFVVRY